MNQESSKKVKSKAFLSRNELDEVERRLGVSFRNKRLIETAFVHRSLLAERPDLPYGDTNERLEFLGDKVLGLAVGVYLYRNYQYHKRAEGMLTAFYGALTNNKMLTMIAGRLGLEKHLRMSAGQERELNYNGRARQLLLARLFEAVVGAIYLDRGLGTVELFLAETLFPEIERVIDEGLFLDPVSHLQCLVQEVFRVTPTYQTLSERGPDHRRYFRVGVYRGEVLMAEGEGPNKKEAQFAAARRALQKEFEITLAEQTS